MNYHLLFKLASKFESLIAQTQKWTDPAAWKSEMQPEEKLLLESGFKPIGKMNQRGNYSSFLGRGSFSSVWEIEYHGKKAAAKVTPYFTDMQNYKKVMEIAKSAPEEVKKHLPIVYEIKEVVNSMPELESENNIYYIIVTELLNPLNSHVKNTLFTRTSDPGQSKYKVPEVEDLKKVIEASFPGLTEIVLSSFKLEILNTSKQWADDFDPQVMKELIRNKEEIIDACANFLHYDFKKQFAPAENNKNKLIKIMEEILIKKLGKDYNQYTYQENNEEAEEEFINPDYWKNFRTLAEKITKDLLISVLNNFRFAFPSAHDVFDIEERKNYYQALPEAQSLLHALQVLKDDFFFSWDDIWSNNLMERPGTREIVISDLGEFR